jgi:hypothetical protein
LIAFARGRAHAGAFSLPGQLLDQAVWRPSVATGEVPPGQPRSLDLASRYPLPAPLTPLIGRARDVAVVSAALQHATEYTRHQAAACAQLPPAAWGPPGSPAGPCHSLWRLRRPRQLPYNYARADAIGVPRQGPSLLAGLVVCGNMRVSHDLAL